MSSDGELVRRAQAGDGHAFDCLVQRHGRLVLSLARNIIRNREDAEDVAQDVFVRFFRSLAKVDPERPLEPWLVRLTVNAARTSARRGTRHRAESLESHGGGESASPGPAGELSALEFRVSLDEALESLTARERQVFLLRDVEGLEVSVIAEALEIAEVTVRRQSADGRRKVLAWFKANRPEYVGQRLTPAPR